MQRRFIFGKHGRDRRAFFPVAAGRRGGVRRDVTHLRGRDADLYTRAVDLLVSRLRRKLEPLACIKTLRHAGYALALAPAVA